MPLILAVFCSINKLSPVAAIELAGSLGTPILAVLAAMLVALVAMSVVLVDILVVLVAISVVLVAILVVLVAILPVLVSTCKLRPVANTGGTAKLSLGIPRLPV